MDKQRVDALVVNEATIGEDIDDYLDENNGENMSSIEDIDGKIQQIEELRATYRGRHSKLKLGKYRKRIASVKNYNLKAIMSQV